MPRFMVMPLLFEMTTKTGCVLSTATTLRWLMSPTTSPMSLVSALSNMSVFVIVSATTVSAIVCLFIVHLTKVSCEGREMGLFGQHCYGMWLDERQIKGGL